MAFSDMKKPETAKEDRRGKRLWWIKLPKDFFTSNNVVKKMRKLPGGDTYVVITLKLLLLALDNDFRIYYEGVEDTFPKDIALTLDESPEAVEVTLRILIQQGWLVQEDPETIFAPKSLEMSGSESESAKRVRAYRERIKDSESMLLPLHCNENVTLEKRREEKRRTEIEKMQEGKEPLSSLITLCPEAFSEDRTASIPTLTEVMDFREKTGIRMLDASVFYTALSNLEWIIDEHPVTDWMLLYSSIESLMREGRIIGGLYD